MMKKRKSCTKICESLTSHARLKRKRRIIMRKYLLILILCFFILPFHANAEEVVVCTTSHADPNAFSVTVKGKFLTMDDEVKDPTGLINTWRAEACQKKYTNPATGKPLSIRDMKSIKHSPLLDKYAEIRAAEATIIPMHIRPGGESVINMSLNCLGENITSMSWEANMDDALNMFYTEKPSGGHYQAMINPLNCYYGIACIQSDEAARKTTCVIVFSQELGASQTLINQLKNNKYLRKEGDNECDIQISPNYIKEMTCKIPDKIKTNDTLILDPRYKIFFSSNYSYVHLNNAIYQSSNNDVIRVKEDGSLIALKAGKATITIKGTGSWEIKKTIEVSDNAKSVEELTEKDYKEIKITKADIKSKDITKQSKTKTSKKKTTAKTGKQTRKITRKGITYHLSKKTASVVFCNKKLKSIVIPNTIRVGKKTYKVTVIGNNACKNNRKLKRVVIGKNVLKIGKNAFYNCRNCKKFTIKTIKLKKGSIGKNAFKNIHRKAKIKVPKKKKATYRKLFKPMKLSKKIS